MGIVAAVFALITINFEAFNQAQLNIKFILLMNLSLVFALCVFFGLLHIIISHQKKRGFSIIYICLLILIIAAFFAVYLFL